MVCMGTGTIVCIGAGAPHEHEFSTPRFLPPILILAKPPSPQ